LAASATSYKGSMGDGFCGVAESGNNMGRTAFFPCVPPHEQRILAYTPGRHCGPDSTIPPLAPRSQH
jgi:hypothetical protein